jgi:hypothetical protein
MRRSLFTRWLIKGSIFIGLVVVISTALLLLLPNYEYSFIPIKNKLLQSTPGSRVIVVGGSNVLYGQDSEQLAVLLQRPVINDGLIAPLGLRVILNSLAPLVHPGDVIVISPEYENFYTGLEGDNNYLARLLLVEPQAVDAFEAPQLVQLPDIYIKMVRAKFQGVVNYFFSPSKVEVNRFGDAIIPPGELSLPKISDSSLVIAGGQSYDPATIDVLNRFARQAKAKGATVVLVYPVARMTNYVATPINFEQFDRYLRDHLEFPVLDRPIDSCFADEYFYNSLYHLNIQGRQLHTRQLAEFLVSQGIVEINSEEIKPSK